MSEPLHDSLLAPVPEVEGGGWRILAERLSSSRLGPELAVLKRGGRYDKSARPWKWIEGHEAEFDEEGARLEARRLNARAERDRFVSGGVGGLRSYRAEPIE